MSSDFIALIANIALALSFIVGLIFGIVQVRVAARDRRERLTLETLRNFQTQEFAQLAVYINSHTLPSNYKEMSALPVKEQETLFQFAQMMEHLGILVARQFISMDLVDITLGGYVTTCWEKYKVMFLDIRKNLPDPFLGEYFQWLAERIDERMKKNPRQPFYIVKAPAHSEKHAN